MRKVVAYIILTAILAAAWIAALRVDDVLEKRAPMKVAEPDRYSVLFKGPALRVLSLGYDNSVADYLFMKMIQYFAYQDDNHQPMTNIVTFINTISGIDPKFTYAYEIAWNMLVNFDVRPMKARIKDGGEILRLGWRNNTDSWRLAQDLAFHDFYYEGNFEQAANMYDAAYKLRPSYPNYSLLAARLRTNAGKPQLALIALQELRDDAKDPKARKAFELQIENVRTEMERRKLEEIVNEFLKDKGHFPQSLDELVKEGYIKAVPKDYSGGSFKWNGETKQVESTSLEGGTMELFFDRGYLPPWKNTNPDGGSSGTQDGQ